MLCATPMQTDTYEHILATAIKNLFLKTFLQELRSCTLPCLDRFLWRILTKDCWCDFRPGGKRKRIKRTAQSWKEKLMKEGGGTKLRNSERSSETFRYFALRSFTKGGWETRFSFCEVTREIRRQTHVIIGFSCSTWRHLTHFTVAQEEERPCPQEREGQTCNSFCTPQGARWVFGCDSLIWCVTRTCRYFCECLHVAVVRVYSPSRWHNQTCWTGFKLFCFQHFSIFDQKPSEVSICVGVGIGFVSGYFWRIEWLSSTFPRTLCDELHAPMFLCRAAENGVAWMSHTGIVIVVATFVTVDRPLQIVAKRRFQKRPEVLRFENVHGWPPGLDADKRPCCVVRVWVSIQGHHVNT